MSKNGFYIVVANRCYLFKGLSIVSLIMALLELVKISSTLYTKVLNLSNSVFGFYSYLVLSLLERMPLFYLFYLFSTIPYSFAVYYPF